MRSGALLLVLAATGCDGETERKRAPTTNQLERLSTPDEEKSDPQASVQLQPLPRADLARVSASGCMFAWEGRIYLAASDDGAIVRIAGQSRRLAQTAPVDQSGGFFEDRHVSVSVGRTDESNELPEEAHRLPARVTVTNRLTGARGSQRGIWACGG
jgi:hypothetical protein